eukprot:CAMPEP_0202883820 /NCGR_PEP_ID=MMETSP1391-20130828/40035_1 /ASSEMBLY_ACC=CAM_ASM_000867 /TAXON_ID=1034604 /ORGANISM="Chlamydomonas leiostraca, Strain SAG 11-49" /LENGTH=61 /DNA_ID=CAMNT_0049566903 /DNA_START=17 /DNA_END=202 /DNA_ORIENTATION=+
MYIEGMRAIFSGVGTGHGFPRAGGSFDRWQWHDQQLAAGLQLRRLAQAGNAAACQSGLMMD